MKQKILFVSISVLLGSFHSAVAKDKDHIELTCGSATATITCTKFADVDGKQGVCTASHLEFIAANGKHILPHVDSVPQKFELPTIADSLVCRTIPNGVAFSVTYTPDCQFSSCQYHQYFLPTGENISDKNNISKKYWTKNLPNFYPSPEPTIRVDP